MSYDYGEIVPYLLTWFDYNARILAWRDNPKPYYVWVSEIMLQQTRVEAVKGYFDRFIKALPNIQALAEVEEDKLLKFWEGLGYYNRARNLQKAAQIVVRDYAGELPGDYHMLLSLPGIGEYTAGAIASIAFQKPVPAIDGNVLRVMKRIAGSTDDITRLSVKKELWTDIERIIPKDRPGDFNQSLMELGAMVCVPNGKPDCEHCPVVHICKAFHEDTIALIPNKPAKKPRKKEERTILVLEYQDKYAIRRRKQNGLLAGLWEFPGVEMKLNLKELKRELTSQGILAAEIQPIGDAKHIFSHVEWHMTGYHIKMKELPNNSPYLDSVIWAGRNEILSDYSIPNAYETYRKNILFNEENLNIK